MNDKELDRMARLQAKYLAEEMMSNRALLDMIYPPKFLDINEASEYLRMPVGTIYHKKDEIPHIKIGKRLVFSQRDLAMYADGLKEHVKGMSVVMEVSHRKVI